MALDTPIVFLIFNRPDLTRRVFAEIARARPRQLFIVADGPRDEDERASCDAARREVEHIGWPCEILRDYADRNLGCKRRVSTGITWAFDQVESAIILEDDCLPHADFFPFCETLLQHHRDDVAIGHIGGTDYNAGAPRGDGSYYYSRYTSIWGWATWRRAWQDYDVTMAGWPDVKAAGQHLDWFGTRAEARHFERVWDDIYHGEIDTWDGQWLFARLSRGSLSIAPNGNLISNLGCRDDATHTLMHAHPFAQLPFGSLDWPLRHPTVRVPDDAADLLRARGEFLQRPRPWHRAWATMTNKHMYGAIVRRVPGVGSCWARWRDARH